MALVKVRLEAVRYLAAKALYENDDACKKIMQIVTYKRSGVGMKNVIANPYYRDGNSPYSLNIIADMLSKNVGDNWYKLILTDEGINFISNVLHNEAESKDIKDYVDDTLKDKDVLIFLKNKELLLANSNN